MYKMSYYSSEEQDTVIDFMKKNSFAIVTGFGEQYPVATHMPLTINIKEDGAISFIGHIMKKTDHHKAFEANDNVLVMFNGPHTYISASWYTDPAGASTWNYMTAHAKGKIRFTDDAGTIAIIRDLTNDYEGTTSAAAFDKMADEYIQRMVKAIVGFEIIVESLDHVFKLSQGRDKETQQSIIDHLRKTGDAQAVAIADEMSSRFH